MANPTAYELMQMNAAKEEEEAPTDTPSFSDNFSKFFLSDYSNKLGSSGSSSSNDEKYKSTFPTTGDLGGMTMSRIGDSKHFLAQTHNPKATIIPAAGGGGGGSFLGDLAGSAGKAFLGATVTKLAPKLLGMFACDERVKIDMAPLESTEVNDALAEVAFFVKGLRECA